MDKFLIKGPNSLNGRIKIGGAKNAVLPLMTACIIHPGKYVLNNVPILKDTITMAKLLEMILLEAKRIANSDGGTLYMMTDDQRLRFEIMMTDSLDFHMGGTSGQDIPFYPVKLYDDGVENRTMIAAYVGLTGETVNIPDAYKAKGFDFSGTKMFDEKTGYHSKSFLTVPLKNNQGEIIGVLQLLNAKNPKTGKRVGCIS